MFHLSDYSITAFKYFRLHSSLSFSVTAALPIFASSENLEMTLFNSTSMSFKYIIKRRGPGTDPCGTPLATGFQTEA